MEVRNVRTTLAGLIAALVMTAPSLAFAAAAAGDDHGAAVAEKPNIFDLPARWDLSLYTLVVFGLLLFLLGRFAWPSILKGMQDREQAILTARDEAQAAQREAEGIRAELRNRLAAAQDEVRAMIEDARKDAEKLRATEREAGVKEAAAERERSTTEIAAAKEQALAEIYEKSIRLASLMSSKAIKRQLTVDDHGRLVQDSLAELDARVASN